MFPNQFEYHRPTSVQEAVKLIAANPDAKIIAGGHSLLPAMKLRLANPAALVDLGRIPSLVGIRVDGGAATIGAMTTYADLLDHPGLKQALPIIAETANVVGDPSVRSRGTLGGSLAHNDPAADFTPVMLALGASVKATGSKGDRAIAVDDLFAGLLTTTLAEDEIITEISIPAAGAGTGMAYEKHAHPASGYAVASVAAVITVKDGTCTAARVAVGGAAEHAMRAKKTEAALVGKKLDAATVAAAAALAADELGDLNGDVYASADYRAHLVRVLAGRAITRAAGI